MSTCPDNGCRLCDYRRCEHLNVEHDEKQIDVDEFKILDTGTCTDCGVRVRAWQDEDPDGATWGYDIINDKEEKVKT